LNSSTKSAPISRSTAFGKISSGVFAETVPPIGNSMRLAMIFVRKRGKVLVTTIALLPSGRNLRA
jgi:hypothetical protein